MDINSTYCGTATSIHEQSFAIFFTNLLGVTYTALASALLISAGRSWYWQLSNGIKVSKKVPGRPPKTSQKIPNITYHHAVFMFSACLCVVVRAFHFFQNGLGSTKSKDVLVNVFGDLFLGVMGPLFLAFARHTHGPHGMHNKYATLFLNFRVVEVNGVMPGHVIIAAVVSQYLIDIWIVKSVNIFILVCVFSHGTQFRPDTTGK